MGYLLAIIFVPLLFVAIGLALRVRMKSPGHLDGDYPVSVTEPAADEPTPAQSEIQDPATVQRAQERMPPA